MRCQPAINANFYSTGQICSNGTRVFVQRGIREAFLAAADERTKSAVIGDPMDEATISARWCPNGSATSSWLHRERQGGRRAAGPRGGRAAPVPAGSSSPTIFADVTDDMTIAREEIFGPVMSVLDFDTEEEVIARANATEFGLPPGSSPATSPAPTAWCARSTPGPAGSTSTT
jgi:betaine-aldehyde dehydrogenase